MFHLIKGKCGVSRKWKHLAIGTVKGTFFVVGKKVYPNRKAAGAPGVRRVYNNAFFAFTVVLYGGERGRISL
jgi:hypothetical protein